MARTTADEITPPTMEMTTKSSIEIERRSKATAIDLASAASASETTQVSVRADSTFWPTMVERRRDSVKVPVWIAVASQARDASGAAQVLAVARAGNDGGPSRVSKVCRN